MTDKQYLDRFIPQGKLLRVFLLITHMATQKSSIDRLAEVIDTTTRTVYRYMRLLEHVGFQINNSGEGNFKKYWIGHDYYPAFISFFREDVWKIKSRIVEKPEQTRRRELLEQEEVHHA